MYYIYILHINRGDNIDLTKPLDLELIIIKKHCLFFLLVIHFILLLAYILLYFALALC